MRSAPSTGRHEDPGLSRLLDDGERMDVGAVLQSRSEAPFAAQPIAALDFVRHARTGALSGDHRVAAVDEELGHGVRPEVGGRGADGETRRHLHPSRRRIAVRGDLEHLERVDRAELRTAEPPGHPHLEHPVAVKRLDDLGRQLAGVVGVGPRSVEQREHRLGPLGQVGAGVEGCGECHAGHVIPGRELKRRRDEPANRCRP